MTAPRSKRLAMIATRIGKPLRLAAWSRSPSSTCCLDRDARVAGQEQRLVDEHVAARVAIRPGGLHRDADGEDCYDGKEDCSASHHPYESALRTSRIATTSAAVPAGQRDQRAEQP